MSRRRRRHTLAGLLFLTPNLLGFAAFTMIPLAASLVLAFTNWDLRLHNVFRDEPLRFVGVEHFVRLYHEPLFWKYLGNTLFLMLGIPVSIAGSLGLALLLSGPAGSDTSPTRGARAVLAAAGLLLTSVLLLTLLGAGATAMMLLVGGLFGVILVTGSVTGPTWYRTLLYLPHFTAGVATFLLWKKMYDPYTGPLNAALRPALVTLEAAALALPAWAFAALGGGCALLAALLVVATVLRLGRWWRDEDLSRAGLAVATLVFAALLLLVWRGIEDRRITTAVTLATLGAAVFAAARGAGEASGRRAVDGGWGAAALLSVATASAALVLAHAAAALLHLPDTARAGLEPPQWLASYAWAKPALMLMAFWSAVGSNQMLLYLAGLGNVSAELREAAALDGAGPLARFWHITWPQLAPITFFIVVMSVIGGLQGGFDMAVAMTGGGPAGATTTLSLFIYREGFEAGRLGYASAVAWVMFVLVLLVTLLNWKVGSRYVHD